MGRKLPFWARVRIALRIDPAGRRRPRVPSSAHYEISSLPGMVHGVEEFKWVEDGVEYTGTRIALSSAGMMNIELRHFRAPAAVGNMIEIFYAHVIHVDVPYPVLFHNKSDNTLTEMSEDMKRCAERNGSDEPWALDLLRREARWYAYEHSGITA